MLLLETHPPLRDILAELLREEDYEVVTCSNLGHVWMNTERGLDQIALVDVSHGLDTSPAGTSAPRLLAMACSLPLVLITDGSPFQKRACADIGAAVLLELPFDVERLLEAVTYACGLGTAQALQMTTSNVAG